MCKPGFDIQYSISHCPSDGFDEQAGQDDYNGDKLSLIMMIPCRPNGLVLKEGTYLLLFLVA